MNNPDEVQEVAKNMCGKIFLSSDISKQGFLCRCVYISEQLDIQKELYVCVKHDRKSGCPVIIYGSWEGSHSDEIREDNGQFHRIYIDVSKGLSVSMLSEVANELGIGDKKSQMVFLLLHLYDCFI